MSISWTRPPATVTGQGPWSGLDNPAFQTPITSLEKPSEPRRWPFPRYKFGIDPSLGEDPNSPGDPLPGFYVGADGRFVQMGALGPGLATPTERQIQPTTAPGATSTTPTPSTGTAAPDAVTAAITALAAQLAASNEQAGRDRANQLALQQAVANTQLGLQAQDTETNLLNSLSNPRSAFMSQFMLRGNQDQGVPIPPVLAGLLRRQNLPVSGNVPGGVFSMRPQDINFDALTQAFQGANQQSINVLSQDPINREFTSGMAMLAGLDPSAFWNIRTPLPRSASMTPQFIRL